MIIHITGQITAMTEKQAVQNKAGGIFYKRITRIKPEGCDENWYKRNTDLEVSFTGLNADKPIDCRKFDRITIEAVLYSRTFNNKHYMSLEGRDVTILERHPQT